jgi:hypothetical protein
VGNELIIGMKPGLGKAGNSFNYSSIEKTFTGTIYLYVRGNTELVQKFRPVVLGVEFKEFRGGHGTT